MSRPTRRTISGSSLIVGGIAFSLFWAGGLIHVEIPSVAASVAALTVHGVSILLIPVGLISVQRLVSRDSPAVWLGWAGVALSVAGLLTFLELLMIGLALFGFTLCLRRRWVSGSALILGSTMFLAAYVFGTPIYGTEGASDPSATLRALFAVAIVLIGVGLVSTGYRHVLRGDV